MSPTRFSIDLPRLADAFIAIGAAAYFLSFLAAIELALNKLSY